MAGFDLVRELWLRRTLRASKTAQGAPPLSFTAKAGRLRNYRIFGNTVNAASVGDRTANLFDGNIISAYTEIDSQHRFKVSNDATSIILETTLLSSTVTINAVNANRCYVSYYNTYPSNDDVAELFVNVSLSLPQTITVNTSYKYIMIQVGYQVAVSNIMLNSGSEPQPYEPYGYRVPVTVAGKNLLQNTATSQTINGVTFTVNADGSVICNGTALQSVELALTTTFSLLAGNYRLIGTPSSGSGSSYFLRAWYNNSGPTVWIYDTGNGYNFTLTDVATMRSSIVIRPGQVLNNITFYPMIRKADITDDTYEPYHAPVTTPIYLPEPIKMVGDEAEYIDYAEQKMHRIGADDVDVTLPALPALPGTNVLSVGTAVQPSAVKINYKKG